MIPIKEMSMSYEEAKKFTMDNICAICDGLLSLIWINQEWGIRCGHNKEHNSFRKEKTINEQIKEHMENQRKAFELSKMTSDKQEVRWED